MDKILFDKIADEMKQGASYHELSVKYHFSSGEALRSSYRRFKSRVGVEKVLGRPKILCFDIETSPLVVFSWRIYDQRITPEQVIKDWYVIAWSAKWLCDPTLYADVITPEETKDGCDKHIIESMWKMLDEADIVVTHNGNQFDIKKLNTRFIYWGLKPPSHYQQIDTLQVAKASFDFTSNKLDYINNFLGIHQKIETNYELWKRCYAGEPEALKEMSDYNKNDVLVLEELYFKLRPWIKNHPNVNMYFDGISSLACPNCGGELELLGPYYTPLNRYSAYRCKNCGATSRQRHSDLLKEERANLLSSN